jgi:hypothetical protein
MENKNKSFHYTVWKNIKGKAMSEDYDDDNMFDECKYMFLFI